MFHVKQLQNEERIIIINDAKKTETEIRHWEE